MTAEMFEAETTGTQMTYGISVKSERQADEGRPPKIFPWRLASRVQSLCRVAGRTSVDRRPLIFFVMIVAVQTSIYVARRWGETGRSDRESAAGRQRQLAARAR